MPENTTNEYKKIYVPFSIEKNALTEDDQFFHFEGYASTFGNIDRDGDIIEKGAFAEAIQKIITSGDNLPILWSHRMDMPLGIYLNFKEDSKGLFITGRMPKSDSFVTGRVIPQMKIGSVQKMSIGFSIKDAVAKVVDGINRRLIKVIGELYEISLVVIPSNPSADVTDIKSIIKNCKKLSEMETLLKNHFFSNNQSIMLISKIAELKAGDQPNNGSDQSDSDDVNIEALKEIQNNLLTLKKELS